MSFRYCFFSGYIIVTKVSASGLYLPHTLPFQRSEVTLYLLDVDDIGLDIRGHSPDCV